MRLDEATVRTVTFTFVCHVCRQGPKPIGEVAVCRWFGSKRKRDRSFALICRDCFRIESEKESVHGD